MKRAVAAVYPPAVRTSPATRLSCATAPCVIIVGFIIVVVKGDIVLFVGVTLRTAAVVVAGCCW